MKNHSQFLTALLLLCLIFFISCTDDEGTETPITYSVSISSASASVNEDAGTLQVTIQLNSENEEGSALSIPYTVSGSASSGSDYTGISSGLATIADGSSSFQATIALIDDQDVEEDETITVTLDTSNLPENVNAGSSTTVTITIVDNDEDITPTPFEAVVSISSADNSATEGSDNASFTIALNNSNTSGGNLAIGYTVSGSATNGTDYSMLSGSATIEAGASDVTLTVEVTDDMVVESQETIIITLSMTQPTGVTTGNSGSTTITINDNDEAASTGVTLFYGTTSNSSLTIDSWTEVSADGYVVLISDTDSFVELTDDEEQYASTTYNGTGQQVVYNGAAISAFTVTLLNGNEQYFFKAIPYASGLVYDNSSTSSSNTTSACEVASTTVSEVCFDVSSANDTRTITSNQFPSHDVGNFPNADPTAINVTRVLDLTPTLADGITYVFNETGPPTPSNRNFWQFGIATNGVEFHPMGLKPWTNPTTGEENWEWQAKVTEPGETDLDNFGAHVTSQGNYHYHGDIVGLADEDGSHHSQLYGFAGDGFPIYYKYGYTGRNNPSSPIKELLSSYQVKSGSRTGTGVAGEDYPDGNHSEEEYIQDYEYVEGLGDLDECNGRFGVTPEYPEGTYYYVITSDFPVTPNCFKGTPDEDWLIGR